MWKRQGAEILCALPLFIDGLGVGERAENRRLPMLAVSCHLLPVIGI